MRARARKFLGVLAAVGLALTAMVALAAPTVADQPAPVGSQASGVDASVPESVPGAGKVLILDKTVVDGINSTESTDAQALGYGVDVVTDPTWAAMTGAQFASYRAIIIGDPHCGDETSWAAASANTGTWGPVVNGNVMAIGTDPVYHEGAHPGAATLIQKSITFAAAQAGKTGFYADLSCWGPSAGTPVDILNAVEPGWTAGPAGCGDNIAVVATNPILAGLTNTDLEGWGCSVHESFDSWPGDFIPIAIDTDAAPLYTAPDGTQGTPYIMGRGAGLVAGDISLTPETGTSDISQTYQLTAFVQFQGTVQVGTTVTLACTGGPNDGLSTTATTDADGYAVFTLSAKTTGTDSCTASFVNPNAVTENSNVATIDWTGSAPVPPPVVIQPRFTG
jgi:hypothetical protein